MLITFCNQLNSVEMLIISGSLGVLGPAQTFNKNQSNYN